MLSDSQIQPLARLLPLAGLLILLSQVLEIWAVMASGPTGNPAERGLAILGMVAARIPMIVLADVVAFAGIVYQGSRTGFRVMGWAHLALTLVLGLLLLAVASNVLALRAGNQAQMVRIAGVRIGVPLALATLLSLLVGWFSLRSSRRHKWIGRKRARTPLLTDTEDHGPPDPN
jgi:hypothetical protein